MPFSQLLNLEGTHLCLIASFFWLLTLDINATCIYLEMTTAYHSVSPFGDIERHLCHGEMFCQTEKNAWLVTVSSIVPLSVYFLVIRGMFMEEVEAEQGLGCP